MEQNLSRALLMAAGVLVAMLVLALGAYLYSSFSARVEETVRQNEVALIQTYNDKFIQYEKRENLSVQDIVSVINLARECNIKNQVVGEDTNSNLYIRVSITGVIAPNITNLETDANYLYWDKYVKLIENSNIASVKYKCETVISSVNKRVKSVVFTKI